MTRISVFDSIQNENVKEAEVEGSGGGGGCKNSTATSHHIVPDTYCVRVTVHSPSPPSPPPPRLPLPRSPPQARQHLQVRRARLSGGSETDVTPAPLRLTRTKTHTLSCTHTLAAIQNRHQDPAGVTGQRDPELDPSPQHLRQERDAIGFSCDPPPPLSLPGPPLLIKTNCFLRQSSFHYH